VLALVLTFISGAVFANVNITINQTLIPLEETGLKGRVGWERGADGVIEAVGIGAPRPDGNTYMTRMAAIMDAQRNLLIEIKGVQVDAETTMENLMITHDVVKTQMSGVIKGAKVIREIHQSDGSIKVIMSMNMFGENSMAQVVFNAIKPAEIQSFPPPAPRHKPSVFRKGHTGLVIVAKDMGLEPTFSPRVYDEDGNIIYGNKYIDPDFAISNGMVDYSSQNAALSGNSRAGAKPLVINALKVVGNNCNLVISNADAQRVLAVQARNGFMKNCAVVFARN